jgi:hypothetical protein
MKFKVKLVTMLLNKMKIKFTYFSLVFWLCLSSTGLTQENRHSDLLFPGSPDTLALIISNLSYSNLAHALPDFNSNYNKVNDGPIATPNIRSDRLAAMSLLLVSLNYVVYQPFKDAWWQEERTNFHLYRGWRRNKGYWDFGWHDTLYGHVDKLGHFYSARLMSEQLSRVSQWIGFDEKASKLIGPIMSSLLMLEIEIYDGFFKDWGFSLADFTANELGAFAPLIKEQVPFLDNFQLKLSYHPSYTSSYEADWIKDYAGMTFWLAVNMHSTMPAGLKKYCPPWLNLALGYSVSKPARGDIEIYLAPDIDWTKFPLGKSESLTFIKKTLNYFHFPCFSLKIIPHSKFYPIYF